MPSSHQNPRSVLMIRPLGFAVNEETAGDNHFQGQRAQNDRERAIAEFDAMVAALRQSGVTVHAVDQSREDTPDAVFPNNWISFHSDGTVILYPMYVPSRRRERRPEIIEDLKRDYATGEVIDLTGLEEDDLILEGTGAIVFDHDSKTAFMARSQRGDERALDILCERIGYEPFAFDAVDGSGRAIYHTNVMMAVGQRTALVGFETMTDQNARARLRERLADRCLIDLSQEQIGNFSGNALEVDSTNGPILVLSERAWQSLTHGQQRALSDVVEIVTSPLPTIEKSGGSARCMLAGIHLPSRKP